MRIPPPQPAVKPPAAARRIKLSPKTRAVISPPKRDARGKFLSLSRGRKRRILDETEAIEQRIIDA